MASSTPEKVPSETVEKAIDALLKWRNSKSQTQKPKLFDEDEEFLYLILTLKKIPQKGRQNPHKIPLPHSLLSPFSELCLIIDDRPKSNLTKDHAQKKIKAENVAVSKVLKLSKLASDYRPFEAKRKLCNSYDMFLADRRVVPLLPRLLGKMFFKKKKLPVPLDLKKKNWKEQVDRVCSSALLVLRTGTCCVVRVAKVGMERDQIVENVVAAVNGIVEVVPKKWVNVRSFHVKLLESLALPVYQAVPDSRLRIEGVKGDGVVVEKKKKKEKVKEEEGGEVRKRKGRIHEVRYMDSEVGEDDEGVIVEDDEKGSEEVESKKRKKGVKGGKGVVSELSSVKRLKKSAKDKSKERVPAKGVKENLGKQSKDGNLSVGDGESGQKKKKTKKSGVLKSKGGADVKVKAKRSKKTA